MIRNDFLRKFAARLKEDCPDVEFFDIWNHNVEYIEQEDAWERPAVFLEFGPIKWQPFCGGKFMRGYGQIRIHIVTDWMGGGYQQAFEISQQISEMMSTFEGPRFEQVVISESLTNHNHEDLLETIDTYEVRYLR